MAVSNQDIINFLLANPGMSDADIGAAMAQYGVSPAQMAQATGLSEGEVTSRLAAVGMFAPDPQVTRAVPTARGTVIEGDNIDEQIAGIPQVVYETKVDPNNPSNWQTVNPKTGEVIDSGTFAGGGDRGLLAAAAPVIGLAASTVGLPFISGMLGSATGLTGSALSGLTGATIGGGTTALAGGTTEDILKGALLAGGASYGSSLLDNYLATGSIADPGITERQLAIADAKQLADQGLSQSQIADVLGSSGYNEVMVDSAIRAATKGLTPTTLPTSTATDVVNVTGTAVPAISTGGLLSSLVPTSTTTPAVTNAGTVNVTGTGQPQQIDQSVMNLINSQLASNVKTPTNLANVQVTGDKGLMSNVDTTNAILSTLVGNVTTPTSVTTPTQTITAEKPVVTTQDLINTIAAALPVVTTPVTTPTITTPTQTITAEKPVTTQEATNIITSLLPTITPTQAATVAEQIITSDRPVTKEDVVNAVTSVIPAITTPVVSTPTVTTPEVTPEVKITAPKTPTLSDVVTPIAAVTPAVIQTPVTTPTTSVPTQTITAEKPTTINDVVTPATIPLIQPSTPLTPTPVTSSNTNSLGLTDAQMLNLLKAGIGLFGTVGATSALSGGGTSRGVGALPTQGMPLYSTDYFNQIQQNYNNLLPAVPRDVATPLRDWYLSQYGA